ncbi:MAG: hypothetical protein FWC79_01395 [Oscillospiraceae bacterium]|nr:hypothetical protein [Oscillospiraceae bacterium]
MSNKIKTMLAVQVAVIFLVTIMFVLFNSNFAGDCVTVTNFGLYCLSCGRNKNGKLYD